MIVIFRDYGFFSVICGGVFFLCVCRWSVKYVEVILLFFIYVFIIIIIIIFSSSSSVIIISSSRRR